MKMNKKVLLTSLLVTNLVTAQEFYTCVPKKDYFLELIREGNKKWNKIIHITTQSKPEEFRQTLQPGKYRVRGAGAGGTEEVYEFNAYSKKELDFCVGISGEDGKDSVEGKHGEAGVGGYVRCYQRTFIQTNGLPWVGGLGGKGRYAGHNGKYGCKKILVEVSDCNKVYGGGGGGGGGSYLKVKDITGSRPHDGTSYIFQEDFEYEFSGGNGEDGAELLGGKGAGPDGYIIIEKWE